MMLKSSFYPEIKKDSNPDRGGYRLFQGGGADLDFEIERNYFLTPPLAYIWKINLGITFEVIFMY